MRYLALLLLVLICSIPPASAQAQPASPTGGRTALWTGVGAGAGFGIGLWAGLTAFDDAIDSDRKVWTSAIVSAAAGGTLGYLLTRGRRHQARSPSPIGTSPSRSHQLTTPPLTDGDIRTLAMSTRLRR
jgi:hypothetical protein